MDKCADTLVLPIRFYIVSSAAIGGGGGFCVFAWAAYFSCVYEFIINGAQNAVRKLRLSVWYGMLG